MPRRISASLDSEQGDPTVVRVAKSRYHDLIGKPGEVKVSFVRERSTFEPMPIGFTPSDKPRRRKESH